MHACSDRAHVPCACRSCADPSFVPPSSGSLSDATEHRAAMPGLILIPLGASRVSFQPGIDPFGFQPNRTPAADACMVQLAPLACGVDGVAADAGVLGALTH